MEIKVEVISRETIKPSSPIPPKYELSFLDQIACPLFMPLVYFYPANDKISNGERSDKLKKSLSRVLTAYYPLSGRLVDNLYVNCSESFVAVSYFEGVAHDCTLVEVITNPIPKNLNKFLPYKLDDVQNRGMAVQVTFFTCGGMAIGLLASHKIVDALSMTMFANSWAALARGTDTDGAAIRPKFEATAIFPQHDRLRVGTEGVEKNNDDEEEIVTKIFTFPASKISALKSKYSGTGVDGEYPERPPTRIEALSAFIWTRFVSTVVPKSDSSKIYNVHHALNLRTRLEPPMTKYHFGNLSQTAISTLAEGDNGLELLQKMREAIRAVDRDYVAKLKEGKIAEEPMAHEANNEVVPLSFSSLCRFSFYEADFGWGKPTWVSTVNLILKNCVVFMDSSTGSVGGADDIAAWISLTKEDMMKFEVDAELQAYVFPSSLTK